MKKNNQLTIWSLLAATTCVALMFSACYKDGADGKKTKTYTIYTPVYQAIAQTYATINGNAARPIDHAGKIYIKDNFIYLNEVDKGIHIIDNSNRSHPVQIAFLSIPGNLDIAIKNNTLYADMYTDLLAIDISNPRQVIFTGKVENFFSSRGYINGHPSILSGQVAIDWIEKDTTVSIDEQYYPNNCDFCAFDMIQAAAGNVKSTGTAGSMAGMVLMNDRLYAITESHSVGIINVSNTAVPSLESTFFAGYDLQTIFPFKEKLFLGSAVGMFMYDVSDPAHPVSIGEFTHGRACDPVITDGSNAYVTLHSGDGCGGDANELHVLDVHDLNNTTLVKTYPMTKPTGLSKDGHLLFICDNTAVKIFNAANPASLQLLQQVTSDNPYDVITQGNTAMVVCNDGLYQYDYSNLTNVRLLSFLSAKK